MLQGPLTERPWEHIPDTFGQVEDISDALIAREQNAFLLADNAGNIVPGTRRGYGLYFWDMRHLSSYALQLGDHWPLVLLTTLDPAGGFEQVLGNARFEQDGRTVGRCTVELHRRISVRIDGVDESLTVTNYNPFPVVVSPLYHFDADFADIFEVRGHTRVAPKAAVTTTVEFPEVCYAYGGSDGLDRSTTLRFDKTPSDLSEKAARFEVEVAPHSAWDLRVACDVRRAPLSSPADDEPVGISGRAAAQANTRPADWFQQAATVHTDNDVLNRVVRRALADLRMLWTSDEQGEAYIAAGTPWFSTLFGRDSLVVALQMLPFMPSLAKDCLHLLAAHQGTIVDPFRSEEPGKILHERRSNELAAIGELPYGEYFGSVDSTPLFLLLAAEYFRWTGDEALVRRLLPSIRAALDWLASYGDHDADGFVEYRTDSVDGLRNQGWKDSADAVMHSDGSLCEGTVALAEVQGYVYAAYRGLARMFDAIGEAETSAALRQRAGKLKEHFASAFWLHDLGYAALGLDGEKRPADVMSSNAGQVLWSGILDDAKAGSVAKHLLSPAMFSGWGLRTLSSEAPSYNPLGYHLGTVWPHDNAIIAAGLKRYGFDESVDRIFTGLFEAAQTWPDLRLPELFGGHPRAHYSRPVPYPVACRPQAWTAGAWFHLLQATLGLAPNAQSGCLRLVRPRLPSWLDWIEIRELHFGGSRASIRIERRAEVVSVFVIEGKLRAEVLDQWPSD